MFELYTEHARRAIYFAKYEAVQAGSSSIDHEHLALGLLWDAYPLMRYLNPSAATLPCLRGKIGVRTKDKKPLSMKDQIPLSKRSKEVIRESAKESDALGQRHIGPEHLMLALLKVKKSLLDKMFPGGSADLISLRNRIANSPTPVSKTVTNGSPATVAQVLETLIAGVDNTFLPYLADDIEFIDANGNLNRGRSVFLQSQIDFLRPFTGKTVTFKVEDEEKKSSGIRICTLHWKKANKEEKVEEGNLYMTGLFAVRNGDFSIFLIQVASPAASPTKEGPSN